MRPMLLALLFGQFSCSSPVEPEPPELCNVTIQSTFPVNGSTTAHFRQNVEFHLSAPISEADVVTNVPGNQWINEDGTVVGFTPDSDLKANTSYDFGLDYCGGTPEISFTTSSHGVEVSDPVTLDGMTYFVDLTTIRFVSGGSVSELLLSIFERSLLLQVMDVSEGALAFRLAVAKGDTTFPEQDICYRTLDQPDIDFTANPLFRHTNESVQFDAFTAQLTLRDVVLEGSFAPDMVSLAGITFGLVLDVREVTEMMGVNDYNDVCALAANVGTACVECTHDGVSACIEVWGTGMTGTAVNLELAEILEKNLDEECDKSDES